MPKLRKLLRLNQSASTVGTRRQSSTTNGVDTIHEDALRAMLVNDPNDVRAFQALCEIVRRRASENVVTDNPLAAPVEAEEIERAANLAVWSLAEELAGNPKAWYPLLALAKLSLEDDTQSAIRRLETAADRDPSGQALAESIELLRDAKLHAEALGLGTGHWRVKEHTALVGRNLVVTALEAGRVADAKTHYETLASHLADSKPGQEHERAGLDELKDLIARSSDTP